MSTFLFHPPGITVKVIAMDCGRHGSRAIKPPLWVIAGSTCCSCESNRIKFKNFYH